MKAVRNSQLVIALAVLCILFFVNFMMLFIWLALIVYRNRC